MDDDREASASLATAITLVMVAALAVIGLFYSLLVPPGVPDRPASEATSGSLRPTASDGK